MPCAIEGKSPFGGDIFGRPSAAKRWGCGLWAWIPPQTIFFLVVWLGLMAAGRERLFQDPGTFWHLAWGEQILHTARVPRVDQFSYTRAGQPVVADQWLAELLMALVHRVASWEGLLLVTATGIAGLYAWMADCLLRAEIRVIHAAAILAAIFLASAHNFHVRPLVATLIFLPVWFARLQAVEAGRRAIGHLWLLVGGTIVWANLHGGVLAGLGTLILCALGWLILGFSARKGPARSLAEQLHLVAIIASCVGAVLINPYGLRLPASWYATLKMPLGQWIQEHRPWSVEEPAGWAAIALLLAYLLLLVPKVFQGELQPTWVMPIVWFFLGMHRVRNLPLFAELTALGIAELTATTAGGVSAFLQGGGGPCRSFWPGRNWRRYAIPGGLVGGCLSLQILGCSVPLLGSPWVRFSPSRWPVELTRQVNRVSFHQSEGAPIFNDLEFGGWLIYFTPRWRVFIDDRCNLYGEEFLAAYEEARRHHPAQLEQWQIEYRFQWALVRRKSSWDRYLAEQPDWQCVGRDEAAAFYHRTSP